MNLAGHDILADAGLTGNQHLGLTGRRSLREREEFAHGGARNDHGTFGDAPRGGRWTMVLDHTQLTRGIAVGTPEPRRVLSKMAAAEMSRLSV